MRLVSACLALCLLLPRFSPCEGRRLLVAEEEGGTGKVMHSEADPVLGVAPSPSIGYGPGGAVVLGGRPGAHRSTWCPECPPGTRG